MIYVPEYNNDNCLVVYNANTIRVYDTKPQNGQTINYRDYYFNSNYIYTDSSITFNQYQSTPVCVDPERITTNYMYRNDIADIMLTFMLIIGFIIFFISLFIKFFFKGFDI